MSCVLRVALRSRTCERIPQALQAAVIVSWDKGDRVIGNIRRQRAGFNLEVSGAQSISRQVPASVRFLERHRRALAGLRRSPVFLSWTLDFGEITPPSKVATYARLSVPLLSMCVRLDLPCKVSIYKGDGA